MESRISALIVQVEIQTIDDNGDEKTRGMIAQNGQPMTVMLLAADLKKCPEILEVLAEKGVKVV